MDFADERHFMLVQKISLVKVQLKHISSPLKNIGLTQNKVSLTSIFGLPTSKFIGKIIYHFLIRKWTKKQIHHDVTLNDVTVNIIQ